MALYKGTQKISPVLTEHRYEGICREVSENGVYQTVTAPFKWKLPEGVTGLGNYAMSNAFYNSGVIEADLSSLTTVSGSHAMYYAFRGCTSLTSVNLSSLTTVSGSSAMENTFDSCMGLTSANLSSLTTLSGYNAMYYAFRGCTSLTSVDLSSLTTVSGSSAAMYGAFSGCTSLTSVDLSSLTTVSGGSVMYYAFSGCTNLTSVDLSSLATLNGTQAMLYAFQNCTSLTSLSFPALKTTSFGSYTNQLNNMLSGVTGCTVHFPSNLQSTIGSWSSVTRGFGGTSTTVLFDLPATS